MKDTPDIHDAAAEAFGAGEMDLSSGVADRIGVIQFCAIRYIAEVMAGACEAHL